jgi:hypothetical protein
MLLPLNPLLPLKPLPLPLPLPLLLLLLQVQARQQRVHWHPDRQGVSDTSSTWGGGVEGSRGGGQGGRADWEH